MPISGILNQDFFKAWSADMAYVLGFFAADGSMLANNRGGYYIEFNITDRIVLEHIQKATGSNHKITERVRDKRDNPKWKQMYRLQIGSKEWFTDLTLLRFTQQKSNSLAFPDVPDKYLGHFVRGYFDGDGDGCVYLNKLKFSDRKNERWILQSLFTSGSRQFLTDLHHILRSLGIQGGSIRAKERGFDLRFSHKDSLALYGIMYNTSEVSDFFLPRKREKFQEAMRIMRV